MGAIKLFGPIRWPSLQCVGHCFCVLILFVYASCFFLPPEIIWGIKQYLGMKMLVILARLDVSWLPWFVCIFGPSGKANWSGLRL